MSTQPKLIASAIVKIIVLGSVSVGKSSLILKYASINRPAQSTIAIDILTRKVKHEGKMYEL
jgi:GTPase SAR1 family protein